MQLSSGHLGESKHQQFLSCLKLLFQGKAKCKAIDVKVTFYSRANKSHFHKKGLHLVRVFVTQRWPINLEFTSYLTQIIFNCRNGK